MPQFVFDATGAKKDLWTWQQVNEDGRILLRAGKTFPFYLDAVRDAQKYGFKAPHFFAGAPAVDTRD
jgi:hypothetical protein